MTKNRYEKMCDEMLINKDFEGEAALSHCERGFTDPELNAMTKEQLINLLGKAFIVMNVLSKDSTNGMMEVRLSKEQSIKHQKKTLELQKQSSDYLNLIKEQFKTTKEIINLIPEIKSRSKKLIPRAGGLGRAANNESSKALKLIEKDDYPIRKQRLHLRGRRTEFINDMHQKYPIIKDRASIERLVDRLNKANGISQKKR